MANRPRFIDLFAGCGGLSLGLEQAGFKPIYVNEINNDALSTYLNNREEKYPYLKNNDFHSRDIRECINKKFFSQLKRNLNEVHGSSEVDLICGGPPCQGFSGIGLRRSYSVNRKDLPSNHLFEDMARFINEMQPKIFLFENVRGLLNARWDKKGVKGEIFEKVLSTFKNLNGYSVKYKLIYSKDYGVPQNRPRLFIIGIKQNLIRHKSDSEDALESGFLPDPVYLDPPPNVEDIFSDLIDPDFENGGETNSYPKKAVGKWQKEFRTKNGKVAKKGDLVTEHKYSKHSQKIIQKFEAMLANGGKVPDKFKTKKFAQRKIEPRWNNQQPNITVTSLPDDLIHYEQARTPTVREWARLQTFPDWYQFSGKRTTGGIRRAGNPRSKIFEREVPKYTQIGNAVPVKLAREIGLHLLKFL